MATYSLEMKLIEVQPMVIVEIYSPPQAVIYDIEFEIYKRLIHHQGLTAKAENTSEVWS